MPLRCRGITHFNDNAVIEKKYHLPGIVTPNKEREISMDVSNIEKITAARCFFQDFLLIYEKILKIFSSCNYSFF